MKTVLEGLSRNQVKGTIAEALITDVSAFLCRVSRKNQKLLGLEESSVYIHMRALKHLYDRKPAQEYDYILKYAHIIIQYPDKVYLNKSVKRGDFCFVKNIQNDLYLCSLEKVIQNDKSSQLHVVTAFRLRNPRYLDHYTLL